MTWQLWVLVTAAVVGVVILVTARFRSAQQVFDELIESVEPHAGEVPPTVEHQPEVAAKRVDELARHRSRHRLRTTFVPRAAHSHRTRH
jgi:hypothetical protein